MAIITIDWNPTRKNLRIFGAIALVAFGLFGALAHWRIGPGSAIPAGASGPTAYVLWALAAYAGLCAAMLPTAVKPLYLLLTVVTYPIGFVLSYVLMAAMFYLVVTPVGVLFKIIGRDAMTRRFDPSARSYWIERRPPASVKRYFRQF